MEYVDWRDAWGMAGTSCERGGPEFHAAGVEGTLCLHRQAGFRIWRLRHRYPA